VRERTWVPFLATVLLVVVGLTVVLVVDRGSPAPRCASKVAAKSPLVAPASFRDDEHLTRLAAKVGRMGPPFGAVRAGVGFNYGQWLHLYGVGDGLLAFTKNNAALMLVDAKTMKARWALRPATKRIAWDASADRIALLELSSKSRVRVGFYDVHSGRQLWCTGLTTKHRAGQPVSTTFLADGDLLVVLPTSDGRLGVARLAGTDGHVVWFSGLERAGRADFLAQVDENRFVVGGVEAFRLQEPGEQGIRQGFEVLSLKTGKRLPPYRVPTHNAQHLVGLHEGKVLVLVKKGSETRLEAHDLDDHGIWSRRMPGATVDVALHGKVVLARSATELVAYSAVGERLWRRPIPQDRTVFPYGFTLDQMPSLDDRHVLVPTTTALEILDFTTGRHTDYPLPAAGVSTTYWPYQLLVTARLIGVVTNTGGILAERELVAK
jgi:hypothetical protein